MDDLIYIDLATIQGFTIASTNCLVRKVIFSQLRANRYCPATIYVIVQTRFS